MYLCVTWQSVKFLEHAQPRVKCVRSTPPTRAKNNLKSGLLSRAKPEREPACGFGHFAFNSAMVLAP